MPFSNCAIDCIARGQRPRCLSSKRTTLRCCTTYPRLRRKGYDRTLSWQFFIGLRLLAQIPVDRLEEDAWVTIIKSVDRDRVAVGSRYGRH